MLITGTTPTINLARGLIRSTLRGRQETFRPALKNTARRFIVIPHEPAASARSAEPRIPIRDAQSMNTQTPAVFESAAAEELLNVGALVEELDWPEIDNCEYTPATILIELNDAHRRQVILINKHYVNKQLWYSSTTEGGDYFAWDGNEWTSQRSKQTLREKLSKDLGILTGRPRPRLMRTS